MREHLAAQGAECSPILVSIAAGTYDAAALASPDASPGAPPLPPVSGAGPRTVALALGPSDSGRDASSCRVTWAGEPGVIFSGGAAITGWERVPGVAPVFRAPGLGPSVPVPQTLRVGDVPAVSARHPNAPPDDDLDAGFAAQFARTAASSYARQEEGATAIRLTARTVQGGAPFPAGLLAASNETVSAMLWPRLSWINIWARGAVTGSAASAVTMVLECGSCLVTNNTRPGDADRSVMPGTRVVVFNHSALLDAPGEFFANRTDVLYAGRGPGDDPAAAGAWASVVGVVLALQGAENVTVSGIGFRDTAWQARGFQSGFNSAPSSLGFPDDAAVVVAGGSSVRLDGLGFVGTGGGGVLLASGARDVQVVGGTFRRVGQSGVMAAGDGASQPQGLLVDNCTMDVVGERLASAAGVLLSTASRVVVSRNAISNTSRWGVAVRSNGATSLSSDVTISGNRIVRTGLHTRDLGAVSNIDSSGGLATGVVVRGNCVRDVIGSDTDEDGRVLRPFFSWGVYCDNYSSNMLVRDNVVVNVSCASLFYHEGRNNTARNNVLASGAQAVRPGGHWAAFSVGPPSPQPAAPLQNTFSTNIVLSPGSGDAASVWVNSHGVSPARSLDPAGVTGNVYFSSRFPSNYSATPAFDRRSFADWQGLGFDAGSAVADPQFRDPAAGLWALPPGSPAVVRGFDAAAIPQQC